jgi:hypothetical protein
MRAVALAVLLVATPAAADPLQDQLLAGMKRTDTSDVAFTSTTRIERSGAKAQVIVTRYDPRSPAGRRWTVVSIDGRAPAAKEAARIVKAANGSPTPSYARLAQWFGGAATRSGNTYRFAQLPKGGLKIGNSDVSADTSAEAVVNTSGPTPLVSQVRYTSIKGFRAMLVAKVDRYVLSANYARLGDGRPFPAGNSGNIGGSMMGKQGTIVTTTRFSDVRATR